MVTPIGEPGAIGTVGGGVGAPDDVGGIQKGTIVVNGSVSEGSR